MGELLQVSGADEGVVTMVLDRPAKKNALSVAVREEVCDALDTLASDEQVRVVVLAAAGDTFCAGFDLGEFSVQDPDFQRRLWQSADRFHRAVLTFPLPIVAAVQGPALAGGFDLAVMCDIRVAATDARFGHPEQTWSDVVFSPLADIVGSGPARDLCLTGRTIDAAEALRIGLVSAVVKPGVLSGEAARTAALVARGPRDALMRTKAKAMRRAGNPPDAETLEL
ncbi:MAG TPA: enoyl-CoA hydratase/isomerase family protein [Acidimicrobiales bacterium]|nr:enoyl-CoA hydratase/isomerase family protein [Acidimicrobiales bacterium]